ncbi:hypothetical protein Pint_34897 [Pistacia integerrima]|uniref:Uncharacterized protein n=1 Tax=Pistacia integerrima TaxID=434235 RepID=A0ACC0XYE4_9ROSI|nr:hypothetical protein Pint_34897 [Pistacia integerrima]
MDSHTKIGSLDFTPAKLSCNDLACPANGAVSTTQSSVSPSSIVNPSELTPTSLADSFKLVSPRCSWSPMGTRGREVSARVYLLSPSVVLACLMQLLAITAVVNNLEDAYELIDTAISTSLKESKPVYISISCNLPAIPHPTFSCEPVPFALSPNKLSNKMGLEAAVSDAFVELADACGYALAVMPSAKRLVPEHHPHFIGTYWDAVSTAICAEIVESADAYLFAGPIVNDYSSVGYSLLMKGEKAIILQPDRVVIVNGTAFGIYVPEGIALKWEPKEALRVNVLFKHIQNMLSSETAVIAETGDSWFNCQKLKLAKGCGYEFQMQYGCIGWSVGATLRYAQTEPEKRVIACIDDGSFQAEGRQLKYKEKEETAKQGSQSISLQQTAAGLKEDLQSTKPTVDIPSAENMVEYDRGKGNIPTQELWSFCNSIPR